jgi:hypothetical protein
MVFDRTQSYDLAFLTYVAVAVIGVVLIAALRLPAAPPTRPESASYSLRHR